MYSKLLLTLTLIYSYTSFIHQKHFNSTSNPININIDSYEFDLRILHTNDVHSHYTETNKYNGECTPAQFKLGQCFGNFARFKTVVDQLRTDFPDSLLMDGGDQFQGTMFYNYYKGKATVDIMNKMGYDVMSLGNHEFDDGIPNLVAKIKQLNFPVISANVVGSQQLSQVIKPYVLFPKYDLAVIGFITPSADKLAKMDQNLKFLNPIPIVQNIIDELKRLKVKRIVGLSHNGYLEDIQLAQNTTGLSLIVGGHSHTYLPPNQPSLQTEEYGTYPTQVFNLEHKPVYVVQAYCYGKYLGHLDLKFSADGYISKIVGKPIEIKLQTKDPDMDQLLNELKMPYLEYSNRVVGYATQPFSTYQCQYLECTIGNLLADAIYHYHKSTKQFKKDSANNTNDLPDLAIVNSGGIRAGLSQGYIRNLDVTSILPFDNQIVHIKLPGKQIYNLILASCTRFNLQNQLPATSFIQVSGLKFQFHQETNTLKINIYNRMDKKFQPLQLETEYTLATSDFLALGGDNLIFPVPKLDRLQFLGDLTQLTAHYINTTSPVIPTLDGRILI